MWCFSKRLGILIGVFLCLVIFVFVSYYAHSTKIIIDNRAADITQPTPTLTPLYPAEYGENFLLSNSTLLPVQSLFKLAAQYTVFRRDSYPYDNPMVFRLGTYPRSTDNEELKSYVFQTDLGNYPNLLSDLEVLKYFNPKYPILVEKTKYSEGLPVINFCHLATFANLIKSLGLEKEFADYIKPLLKTELQSKNLTLAELIFYRYYRVEVPGKVIFLADNTSEGTGLITNTKFFKDIGERMISDINTMNPKKYGFSFNTVYDLPNGQSISRSNLEGIEGEIASGNTVYLARAKLNGSRDLLKSFSFSNGPIHYFLIADTKNFIYPPVAVGAEAKSEKKIGLFLIDPLGEVDYSDKTDPSGYGGLGYIGWAGLFYFNGGTNKVYDVTTADQNAMIGRPSGIYSLFMIRNSISSPTPTPKKKPYPDWKIDRIDQM